MRQRLDPKLSILPPAQREIWSRLALSVRLGFVLYGGTAIALHLGLAKMPGGTVKVSFFGGISFGRVHDPLETIDGILLVASLDDLMATKLKALLDRAEVKDYRDIAMMISMGVSLPAGLSAF